MRMYACTAVSPFCKGVAVNWPNFGVGGGGGGDGALTIRA